MCVRAWPVAFYRHDPRAMGVRNGFHQAAAPLFHGTPLTFPRSRPGVLLDTLPEKHLTKIFVEKRSYSVQ